MQKRMLQQDPKKYRKPNGGTTINHPDLRGNTKDVQSAIKKGISSLAKTNQGYKYKGNQNT